MGEAGRSVQTKPMPDEQANADWLAEVLEGLGHEKYHLVGLSRGGWLALNLAIRSPGRVGRVTALDPGGFVPSLNKGRLYLLIGLMTMLAPEFLRRRVPPDSKLAVFVDPLLRRLVLAGLGFQMRFFIASCFSDDEVRRTAVPTRVVAGTKSPLQPVAEVTARLARLTPHIQVVPADLHHGLGFIEPAFLREHVTASEQTTA
jgi:pimeloyl-ACP methyl ester carboxylesterase